MAKVVGKYEVMGVAQNSGAKWAFGTFALVGAATLLATRHFEGFRKYTATATKVSLAPITAVGMYFIRYETVEYDAQMRPERYGLKVENGHVTKVNAKDLKEEYAKLPHKVELPLHHRLMNEAYEKPYFLVGSLAVPLTVGILFQQLQKENLTVSQRIMHSRVFAQAGVLTIFLSTFLFLSYMKKRGQFEPTSQDPDEVVIAASEDASSLL